MRMDQCLLLSNFFFERFPHTKNLLFLPYIVTDVEFRHKARTLLSSLLSPKHKITSYCTTFGKSSGVFFMYEARKSPDAVRESSLLIQSQPLHQTSYSPSSYPIDPQGVSFISCCSRCYPRWNCREKSSFKLSPVWYLQEIHVQDLDLRLLFAL